MLCKQANHLRIHLDNLVSFSFCRTGFTSFFVDLCIASDLYRTRSERDNDETRGITCISDLALFTSLLHIYGIHCLTGYQCS